MAVSRIEAPSGVEQAVELAMANLGLLGSVVGLRSRPDGSGPVATDPVPLHGFADREALGEFDSADFPQFGWRSLVSDRQEGMVAVDIAEEDGGWRFDRVISGPLIGKLMEVAEDAAYHAHSGIFTLRLVDIPGIKLGALWLDAAADSLFLPYAGINTDGISGPLDVPGFYELVDERTPASPVAVEALRDDLADDAGEIDGEAEAGSEG